MPKNQPWRLPPDAPRDLRIFRDGYGVPHLSADGLDALCWGLGYCHAVDRGLQLLANRTFVEGRVSECLAATPETLELDIFFRRQNWRAGAELEAQRLGPSAASALESYAAGINARLRRRLPWELRLAGYAREPWTPADTMLLARATGYVGLAQSQGELERLFVEMVQAGVDDARLSALFPDIPEISALDGRDPSLPSRALLQSVRLGQRIVPEAVRWLSPVPTFTASNAWVLAPQKTRSGGALLANDPHLEVNRLPNVWYEVVAQLRSVPGHRVVAVTMPGLPAALLGRNRELAWGATYSYMDAIDSWIEECRGGRYRRGDDFLPFRERTEEIKRKRMPPVRITFHENEHGVLDGDPSVDGYLLATRWAAASSGARSFEGALSMWTATNVDQGMDALGRVETAWNWMFADRGGNIGYQMSGLMPLRREGVSGFVPLPGWIAANDWRGFAAAADLPRAKNPECGYLVTANQDLNHLCKLRPQNATMAGYRAERIAQMLEGRTDLTAQDSMALQYDTYSLQAERFMAQLRPLLPAGPRGDLLRNWDLRYDPTSTAATLFERFYAELMGVVIGRYVLGEDVLKHVSSTTALISAFFKNIDPLLLNPPSELCAGRGRDDLYAEAFARAEQRPLSPWGEQNALTLGHMFFAGRLPRWLGFERGPIALGGGRATPLQAQFYRIGSHSGCLSASVRLVADLADDVLHTNIAGGPSDRRFSRWYCSDLERWSRGGYKALGGDAER